MAKSRDRNEVEVLRGENRKLKSENKHLKKVLGRLEKRAGRIEELEDLIEDMEVSEDYTITPCNPCPRCSSPCSLTDLGQRILFKCTQCNYRTSKKK